MSRAHFSWKVTNRRYPGFANLDIPFELWVRLLITVVFMPSPGPLSRHPPQPQRPSGRRPSVSRRTLLLPPISMIA
jgi:hypothetical protein